MQFKMDKCKTVHLSRSDACQKCRMKAEWLCSFTAKSQEENAPTSSYSCRWRRKKKIKKLGILSAMSIERNPCTFVATTQQGGIGGGFRYGTS